MVEAQAATLATGLAFVAGAVDAVCFTALGQAFASVVTGNLVVTGLSLGRGARADASHPALSLGAYVIGTLAGALIVKSRQDSPPRWPVRATVAFSVELVLVAVLAGIWWAASGRPAGLVQYVCLALAAGAMGLQSAAFGAVTLSGVSTTFMTGTLTGLFTGLVVDRRFNGPALLVLLGLTVGATSSGILVRLAPPWAAALPTAVLAVVLVVALLPAFRRRTAHPERSNAG